MIRAIRSMLGLDVPVPVRRAARPVQPSARVPKETAEPFRHYFEALNVMDHRTPVPAGGTSWLAYYSRQRLGQIARWLWDNSGMVYYATDLIANYSTPMIPRAATQDRKWNEAANAWFDDWAARADFYGRVDFYGLQRAASFYVDTDGEAFIHWVDLDGLPQVQLVDCWRIDKRSSAQDLVDDGVQLDAVGRPVGYWLDQKTLLPGNTITHLAEWDRSTGSRGLSPIRRGSNDMRDGQDIKGFQKVLSKLSTTLTAVIQGRIPVQEGPFGVPAIVRGEAVPAGSTTEDNETQRSYTVAELLAGDIPVLLEGQELKQVNTPSAPTNNIEVIQFLAGSFVAGLGLPPAFYLDEKLTGPNQRAVNGKAQKRFGKRKAVISRLSRDAWLRVIAAGIDSGRLPAAPGWERCDFIAPAELTIDVGREMAQEREDVAFGLMTRRDHYGARGKMWQRGDGSGVRGTGLHPRPSQGGGR
ncbi:MAG: phage portal protein [Verrucomicrobia bacterium]|nr:phage portal protein [Verrucomicrobiota bacterium]